MRARSQITTPGQPLHTRQRRKERRHRPAAALRRAWTRSINQQVQRLYRDRRSSGGAEARPQRDRRTQRRRAGWRTAPATASERRRTAAIGWCSTMALFAAACVYTVSSGIVVRVLSALTATHATMAAAVRRRAASAVTRRLWNSHDICAIIALRRRSRRARRPRAALASGPVCSARRVPPSSARTTVGGRLELLLPHSAHPSGPFLRRRRAARCSRRPSIICSNRPRRSSAAGARPGASATVALGLAGRRLAADAAPSKPRTRKSRRSRKEADVQLRRDASSP